MKIKLLLIISLFIGNTIFSNTYDQLNEINQQAFRKMLQKVYSETIKHKDALKSISINREELIANLSSTAPTSPFIVHGDLGDTLILANPEANLYSSSDNQQNWTSSPFYPLNSFDYENTWESTTTSINWSNVNWYIEGLVDSEILGANLGRVYVTQSPEYDGTSFSPSSNYFQSLVVEESGDAPSSQDITNIYATFQCDSICDGFVDRIYTKMTLSNGCCSTGGLFGPWYLFSVGFFNPDSEADFVYALAYGDGGFGQLTPGLLKISGDVTTGDIGGFEYISTNINYQTSGNDLFLSTLVENFIADPDFGAWPNSLGGGLAYVGVTVEAGLDGFDIAANVLDQTNPGIHLLSSQSQTGNNLITLSNATYDDENKVLTVDYFDLDGNLPWFKSAQICYPDGGECFLNLDMTSPDHTYLEGCTFYSSFSDQEIQSGNYEAKFWFIDSTTDEYPSPQLSISITVSGGIVGDINGDDVVNVLDVVSLVNMVLDSETANNSGDINSDGIVNVLDIVLLVNIILNL